MNLNRFRKYMRIKLVYLGEIFQENVQKIEQGPSRKANIQELREERGKTEDILTVTSLKIGNNPEKRRAIEKYTGRRNQ